MDEKKLNELFRELLFKPGKPYDSSSSATSDVSSTLKSSMGAETYVDYAEVLSKFQNLLTNNINIETGVKDIQKLLNQL